MLYAMNLPDAILLGVLQGFAEWLPISSEGLVTLVSKIIYGQSFERSLGLAVWLHVGTLLAACIYLRKDLYSAALGLLKDGPGRRLLVFMSMATTATALTAVSLLLSLRNLSIPDSLFTLAVGFLIIVVSLAPRRNRLNHNGSDLNYTAAVAVGLVQGVSIIPGVSRSGVTITALLILGFSLRNALKLSYMLSIPAVAGAQVSLPLFLGVREISLEMVAGAAAAMATGSVTIKFMLDLSVKHDVRKLAVYLGILLVIAGFLLYVAGLHLGG